MERLGEVTKVDGKWLEITFCRPSDCDKCHACIGGSKTAVLRLEGKAHVGDKALVEMPDSVVTQASLLAYMPPLFGLLANHIGVYLLPWYTGAILVLMAVMCERLERKCSC